MAKAKVPISERALVQRINRNLRPEGLMLKTRRMYWADGSQYEDSNLGRYYVIDSNRNQILEHHVNLAAYGRELGVLAAWEELKES